MVGTPLIEQPVNRFFIVEIPISSVDRQSRRGNRDDDRSRTAFHGRVMLPRRHQDELVAMAMRRLQFGIDIGPNAAASRRVKGANINNSHASRERPRALKLKLSFVHGRQYRWRREQRECMTRAMKPPLKLILASIHDVSPRFEIEVDLLLDLLAPYVGNKLAMLVVPNHWGDSPIVPGSAFANRLRGWSDAGIEIFLHGFSHRDESVHRGILNRARGRFMTAGEGEFLGLPIADAASRIAAGRSLLQDVTGRPVAGFIAPAWLYGFGVRRVLEEMDIPLAEDHFRVWSPARRSTLARGPVITWASRSSLRLDSSLAAARMLRALPISALRIGVHPPDADQPAIRDSIERTFAHACARRRPAAYSELLNS